MGRIRQDLQLRHIAGDDWIVLKGQCGERYVPPVITNRCGADIFEMLTSSEDDRTEETADMLVKTYGIERGEALRDIDAFIRQLERFSVNP